ncbi:MAG: type II secretion system F family protein [Clostridia bacterium]|nr:type II secretion system F family protein [Clostridia bacterium]
MKAREKKALLSAAEVSLFCQQVELLLSSGLPLHEGMPTLAANYASTPYAAEMTKLGEEINMTGSLYSGVKDSPLFPKYMKEMVRIGETTGQLENVMHGLDLYYNREDGIRKAIRSAVTYPMVLIAMMACVIVLLVSRVLPIFRNILGGLGNTSAESNSLLNIGTNIGRWVLILVGVVLLAVIAMLVWRHFDPEHADKLIIKLFPPYAQVRRKLSASRFAGVMQMMLSSGFPLSESLALLDDLFTDADALKKIHFVRDQVEQGVPFADAIEQSQIFDPLYGRMVRLGFDAGRADQVMGRLNEVYEMDMDEQLSNLVSMIEPTLVAVLAVIIGAILLAVMLPMASILTSIA